jgi:hypothetical protein
LAKILRIFGHQGVEVMKNSANACHLCDSCSLFSIPVPSIFSTLGLMGLKNPKKNRCLLGLDFQDHGK